MSKIIEAYENFVSQGTLPKLRSDGKYQIVGTTKEGITVEILMTQKGEILSAYPSYDLNQWI